MVLGSFLVDILRSQSINLFFRDQFLTNKQQKRKSCCISLLGVGSSFIIQSKKSLQKENTFLSQEFRGYEMLLRFMQKRKCLSSFGSLKSTYWKAEVRRDSIYSCVTGQHKVILRGKLCMDFRLRPQGSVLPRTQHMKKLQWVYPKKQNSASASSSLKPLLGALCSQVNLAVLNFLH